MARPIAQGGGIYPYGAGRTLTGREFKARARQLEEADKAMRLQRRVWQ